MIFLSNSRYDLGQGGVAPLDRSSTRLLYVSTAKYGGDWHSLLHTHTCTEIFYVVGGMGKFRIEELTLSVAVDDMIIVNPNVEHTEVSFNASPLEYIVMGVEGLEFAAGENGDDRYRLVNCGGGREDTLYYLRAMLSEIENKASGYDLVCQDLLEVLVVRLMRRTDFSLTPATPGTRTSKECVTVRRYIDSHFKESLSLDVLAEVAHVNKYYLVHTFSKEFGISPINYLISRRIAESKQLLSDTDHSLSQISHMLGFSSPSYFSQSFRKLEGVSPMEYRRQSKLQRTSS
ncbi:helix-turn-helix domain-containing protein [Pseudoflavonifractor intestinihominis]|uniref:Helix-turn-helix domain-containing protein n=1 Tax=Pseudoflavonifractor intestinihominis TaxID=3133171 RepID=A0ABV1EC61_9FIRM|nr:helix-turn-helix domain-containing protein [uncultured Pseudoflavonifractor sp.]